MVQNIADMEYEWFVGKTVLNRATLDTVGDRRNHSTVSDSISDITILILSLYSHVDIKLPQLNFSLNIYFTRYKHPVQIKNFLKSQEFLC